MLFCVCVSVASRHHGQTGRRRCLSGGRCQSVTEAEDNDADDDDEDIVGTTDTTVLMPPPPD